VCVDASNMHVQTKLLRLREPVSLGDRIDDWRVCWLGGRDKCRIFLVVMPLLRCHRRGEVRPVRLAYCSRRFRNRRDTLLAGSGSRLSYSSATTFP
jgi:hypothetical protein